MKNLSFKYKLVLLMLLPVLVSGFLLVQQVLHSVGVSKRSAQVEVYTELATVNSALVHELQKERGTTAGFLGSGGQQFGDQLAKQRTATNEKRTQWERFVQEHSLEAAAVQQLVQHVQTQLRGLGDMRSQVDMQTVSLKDALGYYTALNKQLLSAAALASSLSEDVSLTRGTLAYYHFLQAKERAGIERAVLSNAFAKDQFSPGLFARFVTLVSEQNTYTQSFMELASAEQLKRFKALQADPAIDSVETLRAIAMDKYATGGFGVDAAFWFGEASKRINLLKGFEDQLATETIAAAKALQASAQLKLWLFTALLVVTLLAVVFITWSISNVLHQQVDSLLHVMRNVRKDHDLTQRVTVFSNDELGEVAEGLNKTLDSFSHTIQQLSVSCTELASIADETRSVVKHSTQKLQMQRDRTTQVATAVEELSATVQEVTANTVHTAEQANAACSVANDGHGVVQGSVDAVNKLANDVERLGQVINKLHTSSVNISNVVEVINSVSDQTGLLALNAAIEAARAGEQGRGFAVVADEVRTLAQRTQHSTTEIANIIRDLQTEVESAFKLVEENHQKMQETVERTHNVESSLERIVGAVNGITDMSNQIASASEEQAVVIQDVSQNLSVIDDSADEVVAAAGQIASSAQTLADMSHRLRGLVDAFKV